jgi:hypothetical protein
MRTRRLCQAQGAQFFTSTAGILELVCALLHYAMGVCAAIIATRPENTGTTPGEARTRGRDLCEDVNF